jgi:transposase, IS30 family
MIQGKRPGFSAAQKIDIWSRWKAGQSLHVIWRAFGKQHTSIHCVLSHHGGIVPAVRQRSLLALTVVEREDISRGLPPALSSSPVPGIAATPACS